MEFAFTEEQLMIREAAESFLADKSTSEAVRKAMATESGYDPDLWTAIATEMGWPAIHIPEAYGGLGLGYVELVAILEQMGRRLLCSPFYSTVCLGANALLVAGTEAQKQELLPQIAAGELTATLAWTGVSGRWDLDGLGATWLREGDDYVLNGTLRYVPDGHTAGLLVIAAREPGTQGEQGIALFTVPADTAGINREWLPTMDQTRKQAQIVLASVRVPASARMEGGAAALEKVLDLAAIGIAADQLGGAQQALDITVDYVKERKQFGRAIASYQAIKHRAADMMLKTEVSRSAVYYAACVAQEALFGEGEESAAIASELSEAASMAKAYCSDTYFFNAGCSIQLHGGVGFTWEYDVHLYFKRAKSTETFLGNGAYHREKIAQALLG